MKNNFKIKNLKNKEEITTFIIIFIITCIIFLPFLTGHYATDTYNIVNVGYENYAINWWLKDGRIFTAILGLIASKINISIEVYVFITLFCALLISNISIIVLNKIIKKYKQPKTVLQKIILIIICYITIFNFMYIENLYFVDNLIMSISILMFIISASVLVEKQNKYITKALIITFLAITCYQGTVGVMFVFLLLLSILKNKENWKIVLLDLIKCGIVAFIGIILNLIAVKIIGIIIGTSQTRLGQLSNIPNNIIVIIKTLPNILKNTCDLFPKNCFILYIIVSTLLICYMENKKNLLYKCLVIILIAIIASNITYVLTLSSFDAGRLRNSLGILIGTIFFLLYVETDIFEKKYFPIIIVLSYVFLIIFSYENLMFQHKKVNELEREEICILNEYINKYEEMTGIKVKNITKVLINQNLDKEYFPNTNNKNSLTRNALRAYWSADGIVNFYTKRDLNTIYVSKFETEYYLNNRDETIGYKCIGDTLYLEVYIV